ncbi:MAG: hypothetical protein ACOCZ6_04685 [Nanoarchaeota archaeon]
MQKAMTPQSMAIISLFGFITSAVYTAYGRFEIVFPPERFGENFGISLGFAFCLVFLMIFIASFVSATPDREEIENYK